MGAGSKEWISVGFAHNRDVMWQFKLYYYSHDERWHFDSCFLSLRGPGTSTGDDGRGEIVYIDRGSKTVMAHTCAPPFAERLVQQNAPGNITQIAALSAYQAPTAIIRCPHITMPSSITSHGAFLLALAALGQSRVFLWRRVILFDHEFDRHAVKLLENESPIDHRVRH